MPNSLHALRTSVAALAESVAALDDEDLGRPAYPSEWSVADTLSHLGSGAVIMTRALEAALAGEAIADDFMTSVWDEWNAKSPGAQAADLVVADRAFLAALESVSQADAARVRIPMDDLDFPTLVQHRLDEHVLHSWDVRVAFEPAAELLPAVVPAVLHGLGWAAGRSGKPIPDERTVIVHTFDPASTLRLELGPDAVIIEPEPRPDPHLYELHLGAEALVRLVYGRLDADHTPPGVGGTADLDELRSIFTGF